MCDVRASTASSYSNFLNTRNAMYSNTSLTPSPVFAEVKKSLGPNSGGSGRHNSGVSGASKGVGGVVARCPLVNKLGVIVMADEEDVVVVVLAKLDIFLTLAGDSCRDPGSGEEHADA
jgi:hypothetical protein